MENEYEKESNNCVEINLKKSSTKDGGIGYDIKVRCDGKVSQEELNEMASKALTTAKKCQAVLG